MPDLVARESRITLGQLPAELRDAVKRIRIFGPRELAQQLADEMELRFEPMGLSVEVVSAYKPDEFGVQLPPELRSRRRSASRRGCWRSSRRCLNFCRPSRRCIEQFAAKYSSGRLRTVGAVGGGRRWRLSAGCSWSSKSSSAALPLAMEGHVGKKVAELQAVQANIQQFQPWYDQTVPRPGDFAAAHAGVSRKTAS